jgi:hypothetical protein
MTSINLISPIDQASDYTVRFRDPIKITKNSKIYLNYAHFNRLNEVRFHEDQTITLSDLNFIPNVQPHDGLSPIALTTNSLIIPAINPITKRNGYKISEIERTIHDKLTELINSNPELNIYSSVFHEGNPNDKNQNQFSTGLFLAGNTGKLPHTSFIPSGTNSRDPGQVDSNGDPVAYAKASVTAANPYYDNYALSDTHFFHFSSPCLEDNLSSSYIKVESIKNMSEQQGNISFGLYSKELADHPAAFTGWDEKTTGSGATTAGGVSSNPAIFAAGQLASTATAANLKKATLASFLTFEITGIVNPARNTSQFKISVPIFNTTQTNTPKVWTNINQLFRKMVTLKSIPLKKIYGYEPSSLDRSFECFVLFYIPTDNNDFLSNTDRKVYFKVYKEAHQFDDLSKQTPIFDSREKDFYYPQSFFTGLGDLDLGNAQEIIARVGTQIPFNIIASAQNQFEGFKSIDYSGFSKSANSATAIKPNCILTKYKMNFSPALGDVIGATISEELFPNVCEMNTRFHYFDDVIATWRGESFDVYLNGLPIKNFKNTSVSSDGGFSKPLLCSVPVPFLFGNSTEGMGASHSLLTAIYQPTIKNVLELKNQEMILNSIGVQIKNTNTEEPADDLRQAHISFTITDEKIIEIE